MVLLLKIALFTVLVPGTVAVYVPYRLLSRYHPAATISRDAAGIAGLALLAAGAAVYVWCAWEFGARGRGTPAPIDAPKQVVETGLYRWMRNPMYVGVLCALLGETILFHASTLLIYAGGVWLLFHLFVTLYEEPHLRATFGESYTSYCGAVPRWFPRPPRA